MALSSWWRMQPFKKRKVVPEQGLSEGELDDSNEEEGDADTTPAWHCEFQLDNRSSLVPDPANAWVVKAGGVEQAQGTCAEACAVVEQGCAQP